MTKTAYRHWGCVSVFSWKEHIFFKPPTDSSCIWYALPKLLRTCMNFSWRYTTNVAPPTTCGPTDRNQAWSTVPLANTARKVGTCPQHKQCQMGCPATMGCSTKSSPGWMAIFLNMPCCCSSELLFPLFLSIMQISINLHTRWTMAGGGWPGIL